MTALVRFISLRGQSQQLSRLIHSSSTCFDIKWRLMKGLPEEHRQDPVFLDRPDYSFLDGRPVPLNRGMVKRQEKQQYFGKRVVELLGDIDYALKRKEIKAKKQRVEEEAILSRKLKPKGVLYKSKNRKAENE